MAEYGDVIKAVDELTKSSNKFAREQVRFHGEITGEIKLINEKLSTIDNRGTVKGALNLDKMRENIEIDYQLLHARVTDARKEAKNDNILTNKRFDRIKNWGYFGSIIAGAIGVIGGYFGFKH